MEDRNSNGISEKNLEWVFKISTALIIPLLIWVFKSSLSIQVEMEKIRGDVRVNARSIETVNSSIKEINTDIKKLLERN